MVHVHVAASGCGRVACVGVFLSLSWLISRTYRKVVLTFGGEEGDHCVLGFCYGILWFSRLVSVSRSSCLNSRFLSASCCLINLKTTVRSRIQSFEVIILITASLSPFKVCFMFLTVMIFEVNQNIEMYNFVYVCVYICLFLHLLYLSPCLRVCICAFCACLHAFVPAT